MSVFLRVVVCVCVCGWVPEKHKEGTGPLRVGDIGSCEPLEMTAGD